MSKLSYSEQLRHPFWQKKRLQILERDEFSCQRCYDSESPLHVHHKHYNKGAMAWEYEDHELVTLCEGCHGTLHADDGLRKNLFAHLPVDGPKNPTECLCVLAGWATDCAPGLDLKGFMSLDPHAVLMGRIAGRLSVALGWDVKAAQLLDAATHLATDDQIKAWAETLQNSIKEQLRGH